MTPLSSIVRRMGQSIGRPGAWKPLQKNVNAVWSAINEAFSRPVTRSDDVAEYAPTQLLAEAFRTRLGRDGRLYGSNLGKGKNIALFDLAIC